MSGVVLRETRHGRLQMAALRRAGAVIIGKTTLSEFANSGSFSESGFKQAWNGLYPSKMSLGSSGGSASSVATDGIASTAGVLLPTWPSDFGGPITRAVTDLAHLLDPAGPVASARPGRRRLPGARTSWEWRGSATNPSSGTGLDDANTEAFLARRDTYKGKQRRLRPC